MKVVQVTFLVFLSFILCSQASAGVQGLWESHRGLSGGYLHIRVTTCDVDEKMMCGQIEKAIDYKGGEILDYPFLEKIILQKMQPISKNFWSKGRLWSPEEELSYNGGIRYLSKSNRLKVSGCIGLLCQHYYWKKLSN